MYKVCKNGPFRWLLADCDGGWVDGKGSSIWQSSCRLGALLLQCLNRDVEKHACMLACSYRRLPLLKKVTTASQELVNIIVYTTTVGYRLWWWQQLSSTSPKKCYTSNSWSVGPLRSPAESCWAKVSLSRMNAWNSCLWKLKHLKQKMHKKQLESTTDIPRGKINQNLLRWEELASLLFEFISFIIFKLSESVKVNANIVFFSMWAHFLFVMCIVLFWFVCVCRV